MITSTSSTHLLLVFLVARCIALSSSLESAWMLIVYGPSVHMQNSVLYFSIICLYSNLLVNCNRNFLCRLHLNLFHVFCSRFAWREKSVILDCGWEVFTVWETNVSEKLGHYFLIYFLAMPELDLLVSVLIPIGL